MGERVHRSVMNIKVGMFFYILSLFLAFFSRKIFLDCLGAEFIGLTGMLMNIMSFLSVAELGIGTSIVYFLYKPLQEDNHDKINEVMSMLAYLYRCIGFIIGGCGIVVSLFFPWWFGNLGTGLPLVYFAFYSFLATTVSAYVFNYKQLLVSANQKQYLVNAYFQTIAIVQSLTQILLAYYYRNLWLWVVVGLVFTIIGIIVFNIRIRQLYPWLDINLKAGRENLKRYPEVLKKTRQIFVQKIKDFILYKSDELLVGIFVSVTQVAFYGNYTIITSKLNFLVNILSDGMNAGVGNLIAEGNDKNTMKVFWELTAVRFLIVGAIVSSACSLFLQPFVTCWFGSQYRLSDLIVYLLVFNIFIFLSRGVVEKYISAHGLFSDVWAAWTELALNIYHHPLPCPFLWHRRHPAGQNPQRLLHRRVLEALLPLQPRVKAERRRLLARYGTLLPHLPPIPYRHPILALYGRRNLCHQPAAPHRLCGLALPPLTCRLFPRPFLRYSWHEVFRGPQT